MGLTGAPAADKCNDGCALDSPWLQRPQRRKAHCEGPPRSSPVANEREGNNGGRSGRHRRGFLVESHGNLDQLDADLVALEEEPDSRERLSSIFRTIHTIKGTSGFLAFNRLEEVTHVGENLLSRLRDGELELTPRVQVLL